MKKKGISVIVLIITIVVIIILATTIILSVAKANVINNANLAVLKSDISNLKSELAMYIANEFLETKGEYDSKKLNANVGQATYNEENIEDENKDGNINIYDILTSLKNSNLDETVCIKEGQVMFISSKFTDSQQKILLGFGEKIVETPIIPDETTDAITDIVADVVAESDFDSITVSAQVTNPEEVEKYIYILNGGETIESTEPKKTFEGLEPGTKHEVIIKVILKDGTEIETKKEVEVLDNTPPAEPVIISNYGYPVITPYNIIGNGGVTIEFDNTVSGIKNYYSLDDGKTWLEYNDKVDISNSGNIIAKSVKSNGLESITTKKIEAPTNALPAVCYNGDNGTYNGLSSDNGTFAYWTGDKRIYVEDAPVDICVKYTNHEYQNITFNYYNSSGTKIGYKNLEPATWKYAEQTFQIPANTHYIDINMTHWGQSGKIASNCIYEIVIGSKPKISVNYGYPVITKSGIKKSVSNEVQINYHSTSVKKLYKINDSNWQEYTGKVAVNYDDVIYAKGINKKNLESEISSYTSKRIENMLDPVCYNGNNGTYNGLSSDNGTFAYWTGDKRIYVEDAPVDICVKYTNHEYQNITFNYYNSSGTKIGYKNLEPATWKYAEQTFQIPANTHYIDINMTHWGQSGKIASNCIYEITVVN